MTVFNQLVQQQTDFNVRHAVEVKRAQHDDEWKLAIALTARRISENIHGAAIGDAGWYTELMEALDANITTLKKELGADPGTGTDVLNSTS